MKPEYIFNPKQIMRRISLGVSRPQRDRVIASTPWGWDIEVHVADDLGKSILQLGILELVTSEVIWRLTDTGETALDIGANVGYMSSLLANRVGRSGRVLSFEAHPGIVLELRANVERWKFPSGEGIIQVYEVALSDREGVVGFEIPDEFATNRGIAHVAEANGSDKSVGQFLSVPCGTLDGHLMGVGSVGLAKMDVEGHEEAVLRGGSEALKTGKIRDWVFEHHPAYPSPVTDIFEKNGYAIFQIHKRFFGPALIPVTNPVARSVWEPTNFLATLDPDRALTRTRSRGWRVLQASRSTES